MQKIKDPKAIVLNRSFLLYSFFLILFLNIKNLQLYSDFLNQILILKLIQMIDVKFEGFFLLYPWIRDKKARDNIKNILKVTIN